MPPRLIITKGNFYRLDSLFKEIENKEKIALPKIKSFEITPLSGLSHRFSQYLASIKTGQLIIEVQPELIQILARIEEAYNEDTTDANERFLLRMLGIISDHAFIGPEYFHLDISDPCNIDCIYCWFHSKHVKSPGKHMISYDRFKSMIDDLTKLKTDTVLFTGAGEPLMHPRINDMISYVKSKGIRLQVFTNGTLLGKSIAALGKADEIYISVSASSPETYVKVHPAQDKEMFTGIEKNIKRLVESRGAKQPIIVLLFVLCKENYEDVAEMADWAAGLGVNSVRYQLAHNDMAKQVELDQEEKESVQSKLPGIAAKHPHLHINPNIMLQLGNAKQDNEWYTGYNKGCYVGWFFSRRWAGGDISFCCIHKKVAEDKGDFESLWNSGKYAEFRRSARSGGKKNILLGKSYHLMDKDCAHCGNYEVNEKAYDFLRRLESEDK